MMYTKTQKEYLDNTYYCYGELIFLSAFILKYIFREEPLSRAFQRKIWVISFLVA